MIHWLHSVSENRRKLIALLVASMISFMLVFVWWLFVVYAAPDRVFRGALLGTLQTTSFTRDVSADSETGSQQERSTVQLTGAAFAFTDVTIKQQDQTIHGAVMSTLTADYARVISGATNTDAEAPVWKKQEAAGQLSQSLPQLILFGTYFPRAHLDDNTARRLLDFITAYNVYAYKPQSIDKRWQSGRLVYDYRVQVQPQTYAQYLKLVASEQGLSLYASTIDPAAYAGAQSINLIVQIDVASRTIMAVTQQGEGATIRETYAGYGVMYALPALPK